MRDIELAIANLLDGTSMEEALEGLLESSYHSLDRFWRLVVRGLSPHVVENIQLYWMNDALLGELVPETDEQGTLKELDRLAKLTGNRIRRLKPAEVHALIDRQEVEWAREPMPHPHAEIMTRDIRLGSLEIMRRNFSDRCFIVEPQRRQSI